MLQVPSRTSTCVKMAAATAASWLKPKETGSARQPAGPRLLFVKGFFCDWNNEEGDQRKEKHVVSICSFPPQLIDLLQHEEHAFHPRVPLAVDFFSHSIYSWLTATNTAVNDTNLLPCCHHCTLGGLLQWDRKDEACCPD